MQTLIPMLTQMPIVRAEADQEAVKADEAKPQATSEEQKRADDVIDARIATPAELKDDFSVFLSFNYNFATKEVIKSLREKSWNNDTKEWEIEYKELDELQKLLPNYKFNITGEEILATAHKMVMAVYDAGRNGKVVRF